MAMYVLFLGKKDAGSLVALSLSNSDLDMVQYPTLDTQPEWLTGVPTLLCLKTQHLYEGTQCLKFLEARAKKVKAKPLTKEITSNEGVLFVD
jgi:hypothetical protein